MNRRHWLHIIAFFFLAVMLMRAGMPVIHATVQLSSSYSWNTDWDLEQEQQNNRVQEVSFAEEVMDKPAAIVYALPLARQAVTIDGYTASPADVFLEMQTPPPNIS